MSKPARFPEGAATRMQELLKQSLTGSELRRVQSVLLGAQGINSLAIANIVGYAPEHIRLLWKRYREEGESILLGEMRGKGRGKAHLTLKEEEDFLAPFIGKAKRSGMLIVSEVHNAHKARLGKEKMHHSVTYNLLHRHNWRKIVPRPSHPKTNAEAQEEFRASFPPAGKKGKVESRKERTEL